MKKVTKAIKLVSGLTDEEKQEFAEFFKQEEEEPKTEEPKVEEKPKTEEPKQEPDKKEEPKQEQNFEEKFNKLLEGFNTLATEVKTIKEDQKKGKTFGAKGKQGEGKETKDFDSIMAELTSTQL